MSEKEDVARRALDHMKSGMVVGLGTGSTASHFIRFLADRSDLEDITCVATSNETAELAREVGLSIHAPNEFTSFDLCVDGADEIAPDSSMIKGGGGALLREKLVACHSKRRIYIADASKCVDRLGAFPLAVETLPFGHALTRQAVAALGAEVTLRMKGDTPFRTDNNNYVLDCRFGNISDPAGLDRALKDIPGVMETGLFIGMADMLITTWNGRVTEVSAFSPQSSWETLLDND